jgi:hypothetical protein
MVLHRPVEPARTYRDLTVFWSSEKLRALITP